MFKLLIPVFLILSTNAHAAPCGGHEYDLKIGQYEVFLRCLKSPHGDSNQRSYPVLEQESESFYGVTKIFKIYYYDPDSETRERGETVITFKGRNDGYSKVSQIIR